MLTIGIQDKKIGLCIVGSLVLVFMMLSIIWMVYAGDQQILELGVFIPLTGKSGNQTYQYIVVEDEGWLAFINLNKKLEGSVPENVLIRAYKRQRCYRGINWAGPPDKDGRNVNIEVIFPSDKRFEELKKIAQKENTDK